MEEFKSILERLLGCALISCGEFPVSIPRKEKACWPATYLAKSK